MNESVAQRTDEPRTDDSIAETESLIQKTRRGIGWGLLLNVVGRVGSFATSLVLARLLVPHDFGVFAVALAAMQFVIHINDVGLIPATIQWRGKLEPMAPTAATLAASFSFLVYAIFWFVAPTFAHLSGVPAATPVIRLFTASILIDGITAVRGAYLLRTFQQRRYVLANAAGIVGTGVVGLSLALAHTGAYALAGGQLAGSLVTGTVVWIFAGLPVRVGLDGPTARRLLAFGVPLAVSLAVESVLEQSDKVIVGHLMGAGVLGFYLLAVNISLWAPGLIGSAIRFVSLPGFARLSERDEESLSSGVTSSLSLVVLAMIPVAVLIAVLATPTISFLYGHRWHPSAEPLRFLMILMVVRMVTGLCTDILTSAGATRTTLVINLGWVVAAIPALWIGTRADGAVGAAVAQAVVGVLIALPLCGLAIRRVGVHIGPLIRRMVRPVVAGAGTAVVTWLLLRVMHDTGAFAQLAVCGPLGLLFYVATAIPRSDLRIWIAAVRPAKAPLDPAVG